MSLSPEQIKMMLESGIPAEEVAKMVAAAVAAAEAKGSGGGRPGGGLRNRLANASNPNEYGLSLGHPEGDASWKTEGGKFDGDYEITIKSIGFESKKHNLQILRTVFIVDKSSHSLVREGTEREHPIFLNNEAAESEAKGWLQKLFEAKGGVGDWDKDPTFYEDATSETNSCAGLKFALNVLTKPQKNKSEKAFTHYRYSPLGASAGVPASTSTSVLCDTVPDKWPATVKWPPETDAQFAARAALAKAA